LSNLGWNRLDLERKRGEGKRHLKKARMWMMLVWIHH